MEEWFRLGGRLKARHDSLVCRGAGYGSGNAACSLVPHLVWLIGLLCLQLAHLKALAHVLSWLDGVEKSSRGRHRLQVGELCAERATLELLHLGSARDSATRVLRKSAPFPERTTVCVRIGGETFRDDEGVLRCRL